MGPWDIRPSLRYKSTTGPSFQYTEQAQSEVSYSICVQEQSHIQQKMSVTTWGSDHEVQLAVRLPESPHGVHILRMVMVMVMLNGRGQ